MRAGPSERGGQPSASLTIPTRVLAFADHLPLRRLYERFDAIAEGRESGNSSAAHQAVLDRLDANEQVAESLGWTACARERAGGSGRLVSRGARTVGGERELVPDWIPAQLQRAERSPALPAATRPELAQRAAAEQASYDEVKRTIRAWFLSAAPALDARPLERAANRMAAVAVGFRARAPDAQPSCEPPSAGRPLSNETASAIEGRWLDDGGR